MSFTAQQLAALASVSSCVERPKLRSDLRAFVDVNVDEGGLRWIIKDCLLKTTADPGYSLSPAGRSIAALMDGRRTSAKIARLVSVLLRRRVRLDDVTQLVLELDSLGLLVSPAAEAAVRHLREQIDGRSCLQHQWLRLFQHPEEVDSAIGSLIESQAQAGHPKVLMIPHVSNKESYRLAAAGIALLASRKPSTVVLVGPNHVTPRSAHAVLTIKDYDTPFGPVKGMPGLAHDLVRADRSLFRIDDLVHEQEHSIAVQMPFVKRLLPPGTPVFTVLVPSIVSADILKRITMIAGHLTRALHEMNPGWLLTGDLFHYDRELVRVWSRSWNPSLRFPSRHILRSPVRGAKEWDQQLLRLLEHGKIHRFVANSAMRGDCAPVPLYLGWHLVHARAGKTVLYGHVGNLADDPSGVTIAVLGLE